MYCSNERTGSHGQTHFTWTDLLHLDGLILRYQPGCVRELEVFDQQINAWSFSLKVQNPPQILISARGCSRASGIGREMIIRSIWKMPCINMHSLSHYHGYSSEHL